MPAPRRGPGRRVRAARAARPGRRSGARPGRRASPPASALRPRAWPPRTARATRRARAVPHGEHEPAARAQHAAQLGGAAVGVRQVVDHERADDGVEAGIGVRQRLGVGAAEVEARVRSARQVDHPRGEVDAGHGRAAARRGRAQVAGAAADVEHVDARRAPPAASSSASVDVRRDAAGEPVVAAGVGAPARGLEVLERLAVHSAATATIGAAAAGGAAAAAARAPAVGGCPGRRGACGRAMAAAHARRRAVRAAAVAAGGAAAVARRPPRIVAARPKLPTAADRGAAGRRRAAPGRSSTAPLADQQPEEAGRRPPPTVRAAARSRHRRRRGAAPRKRAARAAPAPDRRTKATARHQAPRRGRARSDGSWTPDLRVGATGRRSLPGEQPASARSHDRHLRRTARADSEPPARAADPRRRWKIMRGVSPPPPASSPPATR